MMKLVSVGCIIWQLNKSNTWICMRILFVNGSRTPHCKFFTLKARSIPLTSSPKRCKMGSFLTFMRFCHMLTIQFPPVVIGGGSSLTSAKWAHASSGYAIGCLVFDQCYAEFLSGCPLFSAFVHYTCGYFASVERGLSDCVQFTPGRSINYIKYFSIRFVTMETFCLSFLCVSNPPRFAFFLLSFLDARMGGVPHICPWSKSVV